MTVPRSLTPVLLALALLTVAGCADPPPEGAPPRAPAAPPSPASAPPIVLPDEGTRGAGMPGEGLPDEGGGPDAGAPAPPAGSSGPADLAAARAKADAVRREMDEEGRALIASFERRAYSPVRNGGVTYAEGHVALRTAGVEARYAFTFDASLPIDERTIVTRVDGDPATRPDLPAGTAKQVFMLAQLSLNGAYRFVVNYLPPIQVLFTPSRDGVNRVVTAQPHKTDLLVSYAFDERDVVTVRGTSVRPQKEVVYFAWDDWRGRYLLRETTFRGSDAVATYEYEDEGDVVLLRSAIIRKQGAGFDAVFTYDHVVEGEPTDPLTPVLAGSAPLEKPPTPPK